MESFQEFFNDFAFDDVLKSLTDEHILRFAGTVEEIQQLDEAYVDANVIRDWTIQQVLTNAVCLIL